MTTKINIIQLESVNSTNYYAKNLVQSEQLMDWTAILADFQEKGKGHGANSWESESAKNILSTIVCSPLFLFPDKQFYLSMAVSLGILDYLQAKSVKAKIKWPNDIYIDGKKLAGQLIEFKLKGAKITKAYLGIGLNLNQIKFSTNLPNPISLKQLLNTDYIVKDELILLVKDIQMRFIQLEKNAFDDMKHEYLRNLYMLQVNALYFDVLKNEKIEAKIIGVDEYGQLLLQLKSKEIRSYDFKEVEYLGKL